MKYALITDNSVQWFHYLVCISETGEVIEWYDLDIKIKNDYLSNLYNRGVNFDNLYLVLPGHVNNHFYGSYISEYDFKRVRKMIELFPSVLEYEKIGKL